MSLWCQSCGWQHSYKYAENTIAGAIALLTSFKRFEQEVEAETRSRRMQTET